MPRYLLDLFVSCGDGIKKRTEMRGSHQERVSRCFHESRGTFLIRRQVQNRHHCPSFASTETNDNPRSEIELGIICYQHGRQQQHSGAGPSQQHVEDMNKAKAWPMTIRMIPRVSMATKSETKLNNVGLTPPKVHHIFTIM